MSRCANLNPRFSAKAAFDGNIIDAADSEYATPKAKNYPQSSGRCAVNAAQPATQVQAVRRARPVITPTDEDREHWKGKNVVLQTQKQAAPVKVQAVQAQQPAKIQARQQARVAAQPRCSVAAPAANPNNQAWGQEMGRREVQHQKLQRAARQGASVPEQNANSFVATVPREALESGSFILEMPQSALRYHELANEAIPRPEDEEIDEGEEDVQLNRQYWKGKQIVQQAAAQQQRKAITRGPGCQQRAAPATGDTVRAVPRKVVPRQQAAPQKVAAKQAAPAQRVVVQKQATPQRAAVQAKKQAAPVKKAGGCPCAQK